MNEQCSEHVWVRLSGFGLKVLPMKSFRASYSDQEPRCLDVELADGRFARIIPDNGGCKSKIDRSTTASLFEVVEMGQGVDLDRWWIETKLYSIDWPAGLTLHSDDIAPIELANDDGVLCYAQSLKGNPALHTLRGHGQGIIEQSSNDGVPSVLLSYEHDDAHWRQVGEEFSRMICASFEWARS